MFSMCSPGSVPLSQGATRASPASPTHPSWFPPLLRLATKVLVQIVEHRTRPLEPDFVLLMRQRDSSYESLEAECVLAAKLDRKSTRLNSSHITISYAVFCLKKKK